MRHALPLMSAVILLSACSTAGTDRTSPEAQYRALELAAVGNLQCAWENQTRCSHIIENRSTFARFFAPETLGGITEQRKSDARRVATRFIVEASAGISQCRRVDTPSIPLVRDVQIAGKAYRVEGTSPVTTTSSCFLIADQENS